MAPSPHDIEVATAALRAEADTWSAQSGTVDEVAHTIDTLRFTAIEAGLFVVVLGPYTELLSSVRQRCVEGGAEMGRIATTLRSVADVYDDEERRHVHALANLY
jgi:hypothetical protein